MFCVHSRAQKSSDSTPLPYPVKPVPSASQGTPYTTVPLPPVEVYSMSSFNTHAGAGQSSIEYRSADQMDAADSDLVAKAQPSIRDGATFAGIDFDKGTWTYQQLVCKALPGHLFLLYKQSNGPGDVSQFSAAIPRSGEVHVRIIPVQRRGFSMFSPAPVNQLDIAKFNRIRADEALTQAPDWLAVSMCYAALTGPGLQVSWPSNKPAAKDAPLAFPPMLEVETNGDSMVRFVDVATPGQPMQWALTFDAKGHLIKVARDATQGYAIKMVPKS